MNSTRKAKPHNSLFLQGVLIVALPCIINSAFIFCLNQHWQKTAQAALATEQRLKTILTLDDAFDAFLTFGYDILSNTFRGARSAQHGNEFIDSNHVVNGKTVANLSPEAKSLLDKFIEITHDLENLIETVDRNNLRDSRSRFNSFASILKNACASGSQLDTMLLEQIRTSTLNAATDKKLSADAFTLFLIAVMVEIVVGLLLFVLFVRNIVRRLRNLAGNAALVDQWSELPEVGGNDQLNFIDSVFKDSGARLKAITKHSDEEKEHLIEVAKNLAMKVKSFFAEVEVEQANLSSGTKKAYEEWVASAQCAVTRLQSSTAHLVPDRRTRTISSSKKGDIEFSDVSLFELIESCFRELGPLATVKGVSLFNSCEQKPISARRDKLTLVVMKYLVNALKNAPPGSQISVGQAQRDNWINVNVRDAGEAVSTAAQKLIFNDGTNGLYVCKAVLENEGGRFGAKALGKTGNEFWFALPVVPPKLKSTFSVDELVGVGADSRYRQQKYIFQSGLFRKAALIVFVPMVLHLLLFGWIGYQLNVLHQLIDKGHREEALTFTVSGLWLNSFLANSSAALFLTSREKAYYTSANAHVDRIDQSITALKDSGDLNEDELSMIHETNEFAASQAKLVRQGMSDSSDKAINATLKIMPSMFNRSAQLSDGLNHLMGVESHKTHEATHQQLELQGFMEKLIYAAIFCNFVLAVLCLRFFIVNFTNRINGLVVEARMVSEGHSLPVSTDWNDEVDQIQGFLAVASKNVEVAIETQSMSMTLVALEVSSPLETLDALFRIVESTPEFQNGKAEQLCASVREALESAFDQIDRLLIPTH